MRIHLSVFIFLLFSAQSALASELCRGEVVLSDKLYKVDIVADPPSRARGLMFREEMAADEGMLFIFEADAPRAFWMKNTYLPLDILFYNHRGILTSAQQNARPFDETPLPGFGQLVLEVNAGAFADNPSSFAKIKEIYWDKANEACARIDWEQVPIENKKGAVPDNLRMGYIGHDEKASTNLA